MKNEDSEFMGEALAEAAKAASEGDVPVGAVVVLNGKVIGRGRNRREAGNGPLAHAEVEALQDAANTLGRWRLDNATLYVTLEPCPMCAGALVQSRIARLVFGAHDAKGGAVRSLYQICDDPRLPHRLTIECGVRKAECAKALRDFFVALR